MRQRCPGATPVGVGLLSGFRLTFDYWSKRRNCYVADIVSDTLSSSRVWGVMWFVENTDLLTLDRYEGVKSGVYRRIKVNPSVFGINIEAFAYQVNNPGEDKAPSLEYLSHLIRGAESYSLPSFYQSELQSAITGKSENFYIELGQKN